VQAYKDLMDVVNFLFMPDWGCVHLRAEYFLSTKANTRMPQSFVDAHGPCGNKCYICHKEKYKKYMLPIVHEGAVRFLSSCHFSDKMPYLITNADSDGMLDLLWNNPDWRKEVFGIKTVQKYNVTAFFFQLLATKILSFQWTNVKREVVCVLTRDKHDKYRYLDVSAWDGFHFRSKRHGGAKVHLSSLLEA